MEDKTLRRLVIRAFHMEKVEFGDKTKLSPNVLQIDKNITKQIEWDNIVEEVKIDIIPPGEHDRKINTIMDIVPISTKILGVLGEGISYTLTGAYMMLTGCDADGRQIHEFGSSDGNLKEKMIFDRVGTPGKNDYIIHVDVLIKGGQVFDRNLANAAFKVGNSIAQLIRVELKKLEAREATESHEYYDLVRPGKKKVVILKQIAGQGAMYDNLLFPDEPSGFTGGISIIDMANMPIVLTPNEYRDGAIRSLT
ncbi:MAG: proline reductase cluster protein PrdD [Filifactoraceae bacterium]